MQFPLYLTARAWHVLSLSHNNKMHRTSRAQQAGLRLAKSPRHCDWCVHMYLPITTPKTRPSHFRTACAVKQYTGSSAILTPHNIVPE